MNGKPKYEMDMCSGAVLPKLLLFSLPLMVSSVLQLLFNAADIVVVGRFAGDNALAAVGATSSLISLLTEFFLGFSIGANIIAARQYGGGKQAEMAKTVRTTMILSMIGGTLLTAAGLLLTEPIMVWMKVDPEVQGQAALYLRIIFAGMIPMMVYNFGSAVLRAVGDSRRPLYFLAAGGVVNVILNLIFVIIFRMDVAGVGWATVISQVLSAGLVVLCLMKEKGCLHLDLKRLSPDRRTAVSIIRIGLPASTQGVLFCISSVIIQSAVNSFGPDVTAGFSAANNLGGFVYVACYTFYQGSISFVSQNLGAGRIERIPKVTAAMAILVLSVGTGLGCLAYAFAGELIGIYSTSAAVIAAGVVQTGMITRFYGICGLMDGLSGVLRGMGSHVMPTVMTLIGACSLRIIWVLTFFKMPVFHTLESLYLTYPVTWVITSVMLIIGYRYTWKKLKKTFRSGM